MRMPSLLGPALLVAAVLSTSALPPAEHLSIVPAGTGHTGSTSRLAAMPPTASMWGGADAMSALAPRGQTIGQPRSCDSTLAGPQLRRLVGGTPALCGGSATRAR